MRRSVPFLLALLAGLALALPAPAHGPTLDVSYSGVRPKQLVVRVGDTVHVRNRNAAVGDVTLVTEEGEFGVPTLPRGGDFHLTLEKPAEIRFFVKEFPQARGSLLVVEAEE